MFEPGAVALAAVNDEAFSITQPRPVPDIPVVQMRRLVTASPITVAVQLRR
jgi:hypothetical protein